MTSAVPSPMPRMRKASSIPITECSEVKAMMPMPTALSASAQGTTTRGSKRAMSGTAR